MLAAGHVRAATPDPEAASADPLALYGPEILFDVYRNGEKVGIHRVRFEENDPGILVESRFEIAIEVLFVTLYRYRYESRALWFGDALQSLRAEIDDDGSPFFVEARRNEAGIAISTPKGYEETFPPLFPTNHWNPAVLGQNRVLNTLTGQINQVVITPRGIEPIPTERGVVSATRYAYEGDLQTEVWYDDHGRWVKMRFEGTDGSSIEYACRRCQSGTQERASR
jgi:hypothetical protein